MSWFWFALEARIGWFIGEVILVLVIVLIYAIIVALIFIPRMIYQARCKHLHYHETMACNAICDNCGKNLGFIGLIRDKK